MAHNSGNHAPGRPRKESKKQKVKINIEKNKKNREEKRLKIRNKWRKDEDYQKKQKERLERLKSKAGYERNIKEGELQKINKKANNKKRRTKKHY